MREQKVMGGRERRRRILNPRRVTALQMADEGRTPWLVEGRPEGNAVDDGTTVFDFGVSRKPASPRRPSTPTCRSNDGTSRMTSSA